jgi:ankyrin repeat protein
MHHGVKLFTLFIFLNSTLCAMDPSYASSLASYSAPYSAEATEDRTEDRSLPDLGEQLRKAIRRYRRWEALELIAAGAPVNLEPFKQTYGAFRESDLKLSALQLAAKQGDLEVLRALLKAGASLAIQRMPHRAWLGVTKWSEAEEVAHEKSALIYAAERGHFACLKELLAAKADVHEKDYSGYNALIWAVKKGERLDCVRELIAAKSDPNSRIGQSGDMVLLIAIQKKDEACVQALIAAKAEVSNKQFADIAGDTPLVCAVKHGALGCMWMLIDAKADVNKIADYGVTPLIEAARNGNLAGVRMLLAAGARATAQGARIDTALDIAALGGHIEICKLLVKALLKMPNKKQSTSIITVFGLMRRKVKIKQGEVYRNRELFFGDLFRRAIEAQNRDNFGESLAGKQVNKLRADSQPQYKMAGNSLFTTYGNNEKQSKCSIQ